MKSIEEIQQDRVRLENEFAPKIEAARAAVEEVEAEFEDVRERRNAALTEHARLVNEYEDQRVLLGKR